MKLSVAQHRNLKWLHEHGGSGYLDKYCRLCAGGENLPTGAWPSLLNLVANNMITGNDGRLAITIHGAGYLRDFKG